MATIGDRNTLGGCARLPLPEKFSGKMDDWEDWSYSVKNYVALFKTDILEVMERSERSERPITEQDVVGMMTDPDDVQRLLEFTRQLPYLLTQLTTDSARLIVRGNMSQNGFESWRLVKDSRYQELHRTFHCRLVCWNTSLGLRTLEMS